MSGEWTWVAVVHRPGPTAPTEGSLFAAPGFRDHVAFLQRMHEAGYLVAAGPLPAAPGTGMAVLRLPGAGRESEAADLAAQDASVTSGLFTAPVRPWDVRFHGELS